MSNTPSLCTSTFGIIKPTAVARKEVGEIISCLEDANFIVRRMRTVELTQEEAETLYAEHAQRDFFADLCAYMRSGLVVVMELWHPSDAAWKEWRA